MQLFFIEIMGCCRFRYGFMRLDAETKRTKRTAQRGCLSLASRFGQCRLSHGRDFKVVVAEKAVGNVVYNSRHGSDIPRRLIGYAFIVTR